MPRSSLLISLLVLVLPLIGQVAGTLSKTDRPTLNTASFAPFVTASGRADGITWMDRMMLDGERQDLPFIQKKLLLGAGTTGVKAHLNETRYVPLSVEELLKLPVSGVPSVEPEVHAIVGIQRTRTMMLLRIIPYRRKATSGAIERLASCPLGPVEEHNAGAGGAECAVSPEHSKPASGSMITDQNAQSPTFRRS